MASEPLDENQSRNLIERHRWGDGTKVYTRRIFRARRNNSNDSATASAAVGAALPDSNDGCNGNDDINILNGNPLEKSSPTPIAEDGNSRQQDPPLQQEPAKAVLLTEDSVRERQEEGASSDGLARLDSMDVLPGSGEAVVQPESRAAVESVMEPESREVVENVMEPESREVVESVIEPESREAVENLIEPAESREMVESVMEPESREVVENVMEPESREVVESVMEPESREAVENLIEPAESREMEETAMEPDSREAMELRGSKEAVDTVVQLENTKAKGLPQSRGETPKAESREMLEPEIRENLEPESEKMVVELESREIVEPESRGTEEPESRVTEEPESRETVEPRNRENMEWESTELAVEPETREILDSGGRENVELESREMVVEPETREAMEQRESRKMVVEPESKEADVLPDSREVVQPPPVNGNGTPEANGVLRLQHLHHPQLVEAWPRQPVITRVEDRVRINVSGARSRDEIWELRRELEAELDQVRSIFKKLEAKELQLTAYNRSNLVSNMNSNVGMPNGNNYAVNTFIGGVGGNFGGYNSQPQYASSDFVERRTLTRVNSEVGSVGQPETRPFSRSLSVSVVENNHGAGEFVEREKRTPKVNKFYRNSEFLLGKDRLPPESNKKLKPNGAGRKHGGDGEHVFGFGYDKQQRERLFRSCSSLLQRLMKHKFGWVFNTPVDAKRLGLHDYHDIIKHPMDLGTIKTRLSQNFYKSPKEFAEDVRLVFHNAMTYNPKGQDVHIMAETLLQIFEERWTVIQTEYNPHWRYQMYHDAGLPTPTSRKAPPTQYYTNAPAHAPAPITVPLTPVPQLRTLDRSESMTTPVDPKLKPSNFSHVVGRTPVLKKPKAKDPNKRDMTYEEKQKLSTNLQSLPSEKLDAIVQIIKKRNSTLNQHDDEIEVDIDSVDAETLWELDRFVTNYKKNLSKNKRKAEIALQARALAAQTIPVTNPVPAVVDAQKENRIVENNAPTTQAEKQGDNVSRSSSSSSSSSDSGSSSSDSDSDSSSAYGSDAGRSPRT